MTSRAGLAAIAALTVAATAPAAPAAGPPFHDQPASPRSLPADNLPPFGMLDAQGRLVPEPDLHGVPLHRGPGAPPESTARGPSLKLATLMARAAVDACGRQGIRVGSAVIDTAGEARAMLTADGSDGSHVFVAMRKALAALAFAAPSSKVRALVDADPRQLAKVTPAMFVEGGAVPLFSRGKLIGALGVSGAAGLPIGRQDEACAAAGRDAVGAR